MDEEENFFDNPAWAAEPEEVVNETAAGLYWMLARLCASVSNVEPENSVGKVELQEKFDFMKANCANLKEADLKERFLSEVSITYGASYKCPCELGGGSKCMEKCNARSRAFIERSRRATLDMSNKGERLGWLMTTIEKSVEFNVDEATGEATYTRHSVSYGHRGTRKQSLRLQVNGQEVCAHTFRNVHCITENQIKTARRKLKEARRDGTALQFRSRQP